MFALRTLVAAAVIAMTTGCATGLNSTQESELAKYRANNMAVQEKSPGGAAALGLLPGGGSFYGRSYGYGVVNLLFWPVSILWDPVSGYNAAESINYQATRAHVASLKRHDMDLLDTRLSTKEIDLERYTLEKRKVDDKYSSL
ncbi:MULTISPECIES: hypothetical protein [Pseudomonas]|uniref:hypothetical protein n=1 Tax=Pseudomonas TaxID=286 RepID=UPI000F788681|nr:MULTISPECIES: hypothetical protein [Pseudomonas]MBC3465028.1 hypothetical protein [Pseudomonas sp. RW10S2]RSC25291.1 hypothetical protein EGT09_02265 [Pseudomonas putida]